VDCDAPAREALAAFDAVRILFTQPAGWEVVVDRPGRPGMAVALRHEGQGVPAAGLQGAVDQILEVAIPFDALGIAVDAPLHFAVDLLEAGQSRDRAPREGVIVLTRPSPDFERIMWDV
jgi:hypothetical protein